jgi:hypothetical protein
MIDSKDGATKGRGREIVSVSLAGAVVLTLLVASSLALAATGPVRSGRTYKGRLATANAVHRYKLFVGPGPTSLEVPITNTSRHISFHLYNSHGNDLDDAPTAGNACAVDDIGPGAHSAIKWTVHGPGTFFLEVDAERIGAICGNPAGATYKFTVHSQPHLRSHPYKH